MSEPKKSFLLYNDLIHTVDHLNDSQAGQLFKHVLNYVNGKEAEIEDIVVKIAFEPIKQSLKRDSDKYQKIIDRNRQNGRKGGRPKKPKKPSGLNTEPKKADSESVNDNGSVTDIDNDKVKEENKKTSYRFKPPTSDEIFKYMIEKKLSKNVAEKESEKFHDYYESNGWLVGKNKMKNWKSAVSGWINRMENFNQNSIEENKKSFATNRGGEPTINRQTAEVIRSNSEGWVIPLILLISSLSNIL